jgi:hypothetical protein
MKNSSNNIGNRTRDLPACSAVPQPSALPRAPGFSVHKPGLDPSIFHVRIVWDGVAMGRGFLRVILVYPVSKILPIPPYLFVYHRRWEILRKAIASLNNTLKNWEMDLIKLPL